MPSLVRDATIIPREAAMMAQRDTADHPSLPGIMAGLLLPHFICTVAVGLRAVCRYTTMRKWYLDDTLIAIAWLCSTLVVIIYSIAASTDHIRNAVLSVDAPTIMDLQPYLMRTYLGLIFYQICLCLIKLSILAFYLRMFAEKARERRMAWGTILWVLGYGIPLLFVSIFQCHPRPGLFFGTPMQCFEFTPLLITSASFHSVTDVWLVLMIVPCARKLELPPKQKWALTVVLGMSIFVVAASMIRLQLSLHQQYKPNSVQVANIQGFFVLTILECDIAIICATAPTLRLLLLKHCPVFGERGLVHRPREWGIRRKTSARRWGRIWARESEDHSEWEDSQPTWLESPTPYSGASGQPAPEMANPAPPAPALPSSTRGSTTLSLRSVLTNMIPRSRGHDSNRDGRIFDAARLGEWEKRSSFRPASQRMSMGLESYYDHHFGYAQSQDQEEPEEVSDGVLGLETSRLGERRWATSQESFVMGINDPASPSRMSPVSCVTGDAFSAHPDGRMVQHTDSMSPIVRKEYGAESKTGVERAGSGEFPGGLLYVAHVCNNIPASDGGHM